MRPVLARWGALTRIDWTVAGVVWAVLAAAHIADTSFVWWPGWEQRISAYIVLKCAYLVVALRLAIAAFEPEDPHAPAPHRYLAALSLTALLVGLTFLVVRPSVLVFGSRNFSLLSDFYQGFAPALIDGALLTILYVAMRRSVAAKRAFAEAERARAADAAQLAELRLRQRERHLDSPALVAELRRIEELYQEDAPAADARVDQLVDRLRAGLAAMRAA